MGEAKRRQSRPNVEITETSEPSPDINKGDEKKFSSEIYMANKPKGFWKAIKQAFGREPKWLNNKGELSVVAAVGIAAVAVLLVSAGIIAAAWNGISQLAGGQ